MSCSFDDEFDFGGVAGGRRCQRVCITATLQGIIDKIIPYGITCQQKNSQENPKLSRQTWL